jgi:predicted regulator of Ras-like GTPase activity (Roadblock/LC7/MglB family)/DNA-binding response OmpR family regulator
VKTALIVDDEQSFLLSLEAGLRQYAYSFRTVTASNGKEAVEVLGRTKVDVVVTDLSMPEMDGFQLLAHMTRKYPQVPAIVMTAFSTPAIKSRLALLGSFTIQEKPIDFKELAENIVSTLSAMDTSYLRGITLPAFLQLVEMERKTCTLKVSTRDESGTLCFREGELLEAATATERGEKAAHAILSWDDVAIEINNVCSVTQNSVGKSLHHVVMEGFVLRDERTKTAAKPAPAAAQKAPPAASPPKLVAVPSPKTAPPPAANVPKAGDPKAKEDRMSSIRAVLNEFTKLPGVSAVCLVGRDGFLLDSVASRGIDAEMLGAIASSGYGASESMGRQLGKGGMTMSMSEFERGPVMFSPVGEDSLLVIVAEKDANLGMIRLKLKKEVLTLATATGS